MIVILRSMLIGMIVSSSILLIQSFPKHNPLVNRNGYLRKEQTNDSHQYHRNLSFERIAGYEPNTAVTDHAAIDIDLAIIMSELAIGEDSAFTRAQLLYENGGNSKSYAQLTVLEPPLPVEIPKGTILTGRNREGETVAGKALEDTAVDSGVINVQYTTVEIQDSYGPCRVGSLPYESDRFMEGCFNNTGYLMDGSHDIAYSYDSTTSNLNKRTISGFSTKAQSKAYVNCVGCPFQDLKTYVDYYGRVDYADQWVTAALEGTDTELTNGNADFSEYDFTGRQECAQKGMAYMNIAMYTIIEMEDAINDCQNNCTVSECNDDAVHAWDEAVAFYTGSLHGQTAEPGNGKLFYSLADKRCENFGTCGSRGNKATGGSKVNHDIFKEFVIGQNNLITGQCKEAAINKERIVQLMSVPLIQGTLRYAYKVDKLAGAEKEQAEGATFAASILPQIHKCNSVDAATIYDNMRVGATSTDFLLVKKAFENQYDCLGITCQDIGGLLFVDDEYYEGASPCGIKTVSKGRDPLIAQLGIILAGTVFFAFGFIFYMRRREKRGSPLFKQSTNIT